MHVQAKLVIRWAQRYAGTWLVKFLHSSSYIRLDNMDSYNFSNTRFIQVKQISDEIIFTWCMSHRFDNYSKNQLKFFKEVWIRWRKKEMFIFSKLLSTNCSTWTKKETEMIVTEMDWGCVSDFLPTEVYYNGSKQRKDQT